MAKKQEVKKEVAPKVEAKAVEVKLEAYKGSKDFESNGKSKHMPKGRVYPITYDMAKLFTEKGYGKLK